MFLSKIPHTNKFGCPLFVILWMSDNRKKLESDLKMKKLMRVDTISKDNYDELETDRLYSSPKSDWIINLIINL